MTKIYILLIFIFLFENCQNTNQKNVKTENSQVNSQETSNNETADTISIDTKEFAERLLKGLVKASDNSPTFACMDSLTSINPQTRDFYWNVFKVILKKSDGALSEVVGQYTYAFFKKYPLDFIQKLDKLDTFYEEKVIQHLAFEDYITAENSKDIHNSYILIKQNCIKCTSKHYEILDKIEKKLILEYEKIISRN
jgi:hypothetical protein